MRRVAIAAAVVVFVLLSALVARWLAADGGERAKVERLLTAQGRGDAAAMAKELDRCDASCRAHLDRLARRLRRPGRLEIVRYDSGTSHALGTKRAPTRVVWTLPGTLPTVQCVDVRRTGDPVTGAHVRLLALSAPIGRESACGS